MVTGTPTRRFVAPSAGSVEVTAGGVESTLKAPELPQAGLFTLSDAQTRTLAPDASTAGRVQEALWLPVGWPGKDDPELQVTPLSNDISTVTSNAASSESAVA